MWQTQYVVQVLHKNGISSEIIEMETKGDKILDVSISKIGSKGVFTEELEDKLRSGDIDVAVHSAKDLQSNLADDLDIIAYGKRENPQDVIISHNPELDLDNGHPIIGTSSTRRIASFKKFYPTFRLTDMRGNLQTRILKMEKGHCDALALAYAGVHRMGYDDMILRYLDIDKFTPAVGQGSIALEVCTTLSSEKKKALRAAINDPETETCIRAERAFLKKLEGGCSIPVFGLATLDGNDISLNAGIIDLDASREYRIIKTIDSNSPEKLGKLTGDEFLASEGGQILNDIKTKL